MKSLFRAGGLDVEPSLIGKCLPYSLQCAHKKVSLSNGLTIVGLQYRWVLFPFYCGSLPILNVGRSTHPCRNDGEKRELISSFSLQRPVMEALVPVASEVVLGQSTGFVYLHCVMLTSLSLVGL
jgi:hypothetical protein